jgi:glycogen synthase
MRILLLNYEYPPLGGGAGVATAALAEGLTQRGNQVDVVTAGTPVDPAGGDLRIYRLRSRRKGLHQAGMAGAAHYLATALPVTRWLLRRHRYDVVHIFFSLPTGALLPFLKLRNTPVVVSLRGSDVPGYDTANPGLQRMHGYLRPLTRWIWRRADRVVVVCEALGQLARTTQPALSFSVIRNGVDLNLFRPANQSPATSRPLHCLAVARLIQRKGIADLLHAFALLEQGRFTLEIAGDGPIRAELIDLAEQLGIAAQVHFAGPLDRAALADRYRAADMFTLVPYDEAFGNVFAEALAAGLPVVGTNIGGIPDIIVHGENGLLVVPGDTAAIADAIRALGGDPALRAEMRARNRTRAEQTISWDRMTEQYLDLYTELRHKKSKPRHLSAAGTVP